MEKYLYFSKGDGANATGELACYPASSLRGFDAQSSTLLNLKFAPIETIGGTNNADTDNVQLQISSNDHKKVITAITEAIAYSQENFIIVCDADTSNFLHSSITDCVITLSTTKNNFMVYNWSPYSVIGSADTYHLPRVITDGQSPFEHLTEHNASVGGATLGVGDIMKKPYGFVMPYGGKLIKTVGWAANVSNSATTTVAVAKLTLSDNDSTAITPTILFEEVWTSDSSAGVNEVTFQSETSYTATFNEGDILMSMLKSSSTNNVFTQVSAHVHFDI
tara:strand:- start:16362 stop:17195 length:834 start_codon:yes stop_codon:yes gene_type:complete